MGHLTTGIKDYRGATVTSGIVLDRETDANFAHRGMNCHHLIIAEPAASTLCQVLYSLDGTNFLEVYETATNGDILWFDTGGVGGDGGCNSVAPCLVKITCSSGALAELQVRTYGSVVR